MNTIQRFIALAFLALAIIKLVEGDFSFFEGFVAILLCNIYMAVLTE